MAQPLDYSTLEAAASWYVKLNAAPPSEAQVQAWRDWLGKSQAHAQAWARVEKLQRQPIKKSQLEAVIEDSLGHHICRCTGYVRYYSATRNVLTDLGLVKEG